MVVESQNQQPAVNVYPNGNNSGFFGDNGFSGGGMFFWLILFFFMFMFMGWGNNGNAANNAAYIPYAGYVGAGNEIRQGFDQAAVISGINGLNTQIQTGLNNAEVSRCNMQANLLAQMNNNQNNTIAALNSQAMALQNCCCENRANVADVKYAIANEACSDRAAVKDALYELTAQNNANMNIMLNTVNAGIQALKDENCQIIMNQKDTRIADLERQLTMANLSASQGAQTAAILANNEAQTAALEQYLAPTPRPAYVVQNPNCCSQNYQCNCCGR